MEAGLNEAEIKATAEHVRKDWVFTREPQAGTVEASVRLALAMRNKIQERKDQAFSFCDVDGVKKLLKGLGALMPSPESRTFIATDPKTEDPVERGTDGPFAAQVFKTIVDPFVGRLTFLRVVSGEMKGDASYYNVNREAEERMSGIFTMQGKQQIPLTKAHAGDIVVVAKLNVTKNRGLTRPGRLRTPFMIPIASRCGRNISSTTASGSSFKMVSSSTRPSFGVTSTSAPSAARACSQPLPKSSPPPATITLHTCSILVPP